MTLKQYMFALIFLCISRVESMEWKESNYWQNLPLATQESSLLFHNWSIYSQLGEEGVLDEILNRLNLDAGIFVELSTFYDTCTSNVRFLADRGWRGVFIDTSANFCNKERKSNQFFRQLSPILCLEEILYFKDITHLPKVQFIKDSHIVSGKIFNQITDSFFQNQEVDVLSIDVGGLDYLILEGLQNKPKVIVIKGGLCWTPILTTKIPLGIASSGLNQPLAVLIEIAQNQGYKPLCYTGNVFFVRDDLLLPFQEIKKDSVTLWLDSWYYYTEKQSSYISWIIDNRASNSYIQIFDLYPTPP